MNPELVLLKIKREELQRIMSSVKKEAMALEIDENIKKIDNDVKRRMQDLKRKIKTVRRWSESNK